MSELILVGVVGSWLFLIPVLNIFIKLLTQRGRLVLKSYWKNEWVSVDETKFLYKFDFFGNISNMKVKDEHTLEVIREFYKKWNTYKERL